jgi:MerR family copper efflux transcriptional regulator
VGTHRISELAGRTGVPATTLRYYETRGLLPASRTQTGYRSYTDEDVDRVQFISAAKRLGLPLERIRDLLGVWAGGMCREIRDELRPMVATQISEADQRIADLRTFRHRLDSALMHLRDLPAKDGPCDPACDFLRDLPDRVPAPVLRPRSTSRLRLHEDAGIDEVGIACSLGGKQYDERINRWRRLLGDAPRERTATGGISVRLPIDLAAAVADLVVAEQQCCPFFTFQMRFLGATVELVAHAPAQVQRRLDALFDLDAPPLEERRDLC